MTSIAVILPLIFLLNLVIPERIFQAVLLMMLLAVGTCFILNFRMRRPSIRTLILLIVGTAAAVILAFIFSKYAVRLPLPGTRAVRS